MSRLPWYAGVAMVWGLVAASACTTTLTVTKVLPLDADAGVVDGGIAGIDAPTHTDCESRCVSALEIEASQLRECHVGAAPGGAGLWCTYTVEVITRGP